MSAFLDAWNDPAMRHAMVIHFPIVLSLLGLPVVVATALATRGGKTVRITALSLYAAMVIMAYVGSQSGTNAHEAVQGSLSDEAHELLEEHEDLGIKVWKFAGLVCALLGVSFVARPWVRRIAAWGAAAGGLFVAGWVAVTADHGGRLVYEHGAGTPDGLASLLIAMGGSQVDGEDPRVIHFRRNVRPILVENCFRCHNPNRAKRSGGLDQTTIATILEGGWTGPAVVPGRPDESLLVQVVRWEIPDIEMPAGEDKLTADEIAALEEWVADGAVWEAWDLE